MVPATENAPAPENTAGRHGAWAIPIRRAENGGFEVLMFQNEITSINGKILPFPGEYLFFGSLRRPEDNSVLETACRRLRRLVAGFRLHGDITKEIYITAGPDAVRFPDLDGENIIMHKLVLLLDASHALAKLDVKTLNGFLALRNRDLHDGLRAFLQDDERFSEEAVPERLYSRCQSVVWWPVKDALSCMDKNRPFVNYWQETQFKRHHITKRVVPLGVLQVLRDVLLESTWSSLLQTPLPPSDSLAEKKVRLLRPQIPRFRVLSYNVNQLPMRPWKPARHGQVRRRLRGLLEDLRKERFEVVCLQEAFSNPLWQDFFTIRPFLRVVVILWLSYAIGSRMWVSAVFIACLLALLFVNLLDAQKSIIRHMTTDLGYVLVARGDQPSFLGYTCKLRHDRSYVLALVSWFFRHHYGSWSDSGLLTFCDKRLWNDCQLKTRLTFDEGSDDDSTVLKGVLGTCIQALYSDAVGSFLLPVLHIFNCHLQSTHTTPQSKHVEERIRATQIKLVRQVISEQVHSVEKHGLRWIERVPWILCGDLNVDSIAEREQMDGWGTFRFPQANGGFPESWEYANVLLPSLCEKERVVDLLKRDMGCHVSTRPKEPDFSLKRKLWYKFPQRLDYIFFRPGSTGTPNVPKGTTTLVLFEKDFGTCSDHYGIETTVVLPPLLMWAHFDPNAHNRAYVKRGGQHEKANKEENDEKTSEKAMDKPETVWDAFLQVVGNSPFVPCIGWRRTKDGVRDSVFQLLTYDQVHQQASFFGSGLLMYCEMRSVDILRGRNVALLMENSPLLIVALLACARYSLVSAPLHSCDASTVKFLEHQASVILCHRVFVPELAKLGVLLIQVEDLAAGDVADSDIKTLMRFGQRMPLPPTLGRDVMTLSACKTTTGTTFIPIIQSQFLRAIDHVDTALELSTPRDTPHRYLSSWSLSFPDERLIVFAMLLRGHCVGLSLLLGRSLMDDIAAFRPTIISAHVGLPRSLPTLGIPRSDIERHRCTSGPRVAGEKLFDASVEWLLLLCGPTGSMLPRGHTAVFAQLFGAPNFRQRKALFCPQTCALLTLYEPVVVSSRRQCATMAQIHGKTSASKTTLLKGIHDGGAADDDAFAVGYLQQEHGTFFLVSADGDPVAEDTVSAKEGYLHLIPVGRHGGKQDASSRSCVPNDTSTVGSDLSETHWSALVQDLPHCTPDYYANGDARQVLFALEIEQILQAAHPLVRQVAARLSTEPLGVETAVVVDHDIVDSAVLKRDLLEIFDSCLTRRFGVPVRSVAVHVEFGVRSGRTAANGALRRNNIFANVTGTAEDEGMVIGCIPKVINTGFYCRQREDGLLSLVGTSDVTIPPACVASARELSKYSQSDRVLEGVTMPVFSI
eukprot:GEMP01000686.1.p1 GENE.GEMP01000686.1~~GEMP01000686.1.p1  ORF type:complete len:1364 (+),score=334.38 GEMP01000686.1:230-4321(+)